VTHQSIGATPSASQRCVGTSKGPRPAHGLNRSRGVLQAFISGGKSNAIPLTEPWAVLDDHVRGRHDSLSLLRFSIECPRRLRSSKAVLRDLLLSRPAELQSKIHQM
jgi:hypothetical protein